MRTIAILLLVLLASCGTPKNFCNGKIERINGKVIKEGAIRNGYFRDVMIQTDSATVRVKSVPMEQPLNNIPVCKYKGEYYWVMP